jgi:hypothetical protein
VSFFLLFRGIHASAFISNSFIFVERWYFTMCICYNSFNCSPVDESWLVAHFLLLQVKLLWTSMYELGMDACLHFSWVNI